MFLLNQIYCTIKFGVVSVVAMNISVSGDITPFRFVDNYLNFERT
jgi:hypothetical protein